MNSQPGYRSLFGSQNEFLYSANLQQPADDISRLDFRILKYGGAAAGIVLRLRLIDYFFFFIPRGLRCGPGTWAGHLDLERRATRLTDYMTAGAGGEPFYYALESH